LNLSLDAPKKTLPETRPNRVAFHLLAVWQEQPKPICHRASVHLEELEQHQ